MMYLNYIYSIKHIHTYASTRENEYDERRTKGNVMCSRECYERICTSYIRRIGLNFNDLKSLPNCIGRYDIKKIESKSNELKTIESHRDLTGKGSSE